MDLYTVLAIIITIITIAIFFFILIEYNDIDRVIYQREQVSWKTYNLDNDLLITEENPIKSFTNYTTNIDPNTEEVTLSSDLTLAESFEEFSNKGIKLTALRPGRDLRLGIWYPSNRFYTNTNIIIDENSIPNKPYFYPSESRIGNLDVIRGSGSLFITY